MSVPKRAILEHAITELGARLDLSLVDEAVTHAHNGLLHFFRQLNASFEYRKVVLSKVEAVIGHPKVVIQAPSYLIQLLHCSFFLGLGRAFVHHVVTVRVHILRVLLLIGGTLLRLASQRGLQQGRDRVSHIRRGKLGFGIELSRVGDHGDVVQVELTGHITYLVLEFPLDVGIHEAKLLFCLFDRHGSPCQELVEVLLAGLRRKGKLGDHVRRILY